MSTPEIPAALTPEEWRFPVVRREPFLDEHRNLAWERTDTTARFRDDPDDEAHTRMALGNAALPDGDRRKFTRLHVDALRRAAAALDREQYNVGAIECRVVADMLAAILPPTDG